MNIDIVNVGEILSWQEDRFEMGHPIRQIFGAAPAGALTDDGEPVTKKIVVAWEDCVSREVMLAKFSEPTPPGLPDLQDRELFVTYLAMSCRTWRECCDRAAAGTLPSFRGKMPAAATAVDPDMGPVHGRVILIFPADPVTCWDYTLKRTAIAREDDDE